MHGHEEHHLEDTSIKGGNLVAVVLLNIAITIAEIIGGIYSGSLSLISDALHNFSDGIALIISYFAIKISGKANDEKRTFGYKRSSILSALVNSAVLVGISVFLFKEAYYKFVNPQQINGGVVIWVALIGLAANILGVLLLKKGAHGDLNIKSAYLHLLGDALFSVGVVLGGILIYYFSIYWVDPLLTVVISIYVLKESLDIVRKTIHILMQGVPESISIIKIIDDIQELDRVERIHHLHVWSLNENSIYLEAHVNVKDMLVSETKPLLDKIEHILEENHGISHVTIQFEYDCCDGVGVIHS